MKMNVKATIALVVTLAALAACETTEGFGRDTQKLGNDISGAADRNTPRPSSVK